MGIDLISREDALNALKGVIARTGLHGVAIEVILANIPAVEAEPVVHAHWEDMYGGKYANPRYRCSACKEKTLYKFKKNGLDQWEEVQVFSDRCPHCGAHMDEEVSE